jgi:hypothetical protein
VFTLIRTKRITDSHWSPPNAFFYEYNPMQINWARGFSRAWAALAILWVMASGWHAYTNTYLFVQPDEDCLNQFAKWPDGKPFDEWERGGFVDYVPNDEPNRRQNKIFEEVWRKIKDCGTAKEAAKPLMHRVTVRVTENWSELTSALRLILLPPLAVLIAGLVLGWIVKGFRPKQP